MNGKWSDRLPKIITGMTIRMNTECLPGSGGRKFRGENVHCPAGDGNGATEAFIAGAAISRP